MMTLHVEELYLKVKSIMIFIFMPGAVFCSLREKRSGFTGTSHKIMKITTSKTFCRHTVGLKKWRPTQQNGDSIEMAAPTRLNTTGFGGV